MNLVILAGGMLLAFSTAAQVPQKEDSAARNEPGKARYCAMLKDGKMVLMKDNAPVPADIQLSDGSSISKDGNIRRKDGTSVSLSNGDCVDAEGKVLTRKVQSENKEMQQQEPRPEKRDE